MVAIARHRNDCDILHRVSSAGDPVKDAHDNETQRDWQAIGAASGIGCSVAVSIVVFIGGGVFVDRWLGTDPFGVLIGVALGLISAGYSLYELAMLGRSDKGMVKLKHPEEGE